MQFKLPKKLYMCRSCTTAVNVPYTVTQANANPNPNTNLTHPTTPWRVMGL